MGLTVIQDSYSEDVYLCEVASKQTSCFGILFDQKEEVCRTCPLGRSCQREFYSNLELLANNTEGQQEAKELAQSPAKVATDNMSRKFVAFGENICCVCGGNIPSGVESNYHIRHGFYHDECVEDYLKGVRFVET